MVLIPTLKNIKIGNVSFDETVSVYSCLKILSPVSIKMFKFCVLILSCIAFESYNCGIVKREEPNINYESYKEPTGEALVDPTIRNRQADASSNELDSAAVAPADYPEEIRIVRQSSGYISPGVSQQPQNDVQLPQATYVSVSPSSIASSPVAVSTKASTPSYTAKVSSGTTSNPIAGLTALLLPKSSNGGASSGNGGGIPDLVGGAIGAASNGVKTVLEIKRDLILPAIVSVLSLSQNVANSEILKTIVDVKLGAARTVLSIGPALVDALATIMSTAGDITSQLIKVILCNLVCPIQREPKSCRATASCERLASSSTKTTYSSDSAQSYVVS
uniref:Uncharacterized protein n=2 Tax=Lepeophtheirus salmonis TaxID=72036 RepID=A0A0K2U631_LEPSM